MSRVEVSSKVRFFKNISIANTTVSYVAGRVIGGLITVSGALRITNRTGMISSVLLTDSTNNTVPVTLLFFDRSPPGVFIDNTAFPVSTTNMADRCGGYIDINKSDYIQLGTTSGSVAVVNNIGLNVKSDDPVNQSLYIVAVANGAFSLSNTNALKLTLAIIQD
jgi:hypothetical protein